MNFLRPRLINRRFNHQGTKDTKLLLAAKPQPIPSVLCASSATPARFFRAEDAEDAQRTLKGELRLRREKELGALVVQIPSSLVKMQP
jgi:hypothetical protein